MSIAALSSLRILRERVSSTTNASVSATRKSNFIHQHRNRHRAVGVRSTAASEDDYNAAMKAYSETPYEYKHELGLYYHRILPNLIVGTQPTKESDIDRLRDVEGVTCIFNTQQDKDMEYWKVDFESVKRHMKKRDVKLERYPFVDFSADSLRDGLPAAAAALDASLRAGDVVYLHCTAGMGRSPGLAIAYMYWFLDEYDTLDGAYEGLTSIRPCGPKKESIRGATCDILASAPGAWPIKPLKRDLRDSEGTTLSPTEKSDIQNKLRR